MTDQLTVLEPGPVVQVRENQQPMIYSMIHLAIQQGAGIEQLERLWDMQLKYEANESKKAYHVAMAAFKSDPPDIEKDSHVDYTSLKGRTQYNHATLGNVASKINKALAPHGLSATWKTDQFENGQIKVTCIITHSMGYSESTSLSSSPDTSGGKNNIQAIGSTVSYLQRYTILALTGLATREQDNDGQNSGPEQCATIDEKQQSQIIDMIAAKNVNESQFLARLKVKSVEDIPADKFGFVMKTLENVKVNP